MKFLLLALLAAVVIAWLMRGGRKRPDTAVASALAKDGEAMRQCRHCGTYIPASEAVAAVSGDVFCSEEHRSRHAGA